jgi:hypothetical protein
VAALLLREDEVAFLFVYATNLSFLALASYYVGRACAVSFGSMIAKFF